MYANFRQLARHKRVMHSKDKNSKGGSLCNECGKMFTSSRHLKRHKRVIHLKERETHTCPICKKEGSYKYYSDFFKHKQICEAELPENAERYECSICSAKFGTYYNWKNHHYVCSGVKPKRSKSKPTVYKCDFENCGYITRVKIKLKNHINIVHNIVYDGLKITNVIHKCKFRICFLTFFCVKKLRENIHEFYFKLHV